MKKILDAIVAAVSGAISCAKTACCKKGSVDKADAESETTTEEKDTDK